MRHPRFSSRGLAATLAFALLLLLGAAASQAQQAGAPLTVHAAVNEDHVVEKVKTIPISKPSRRKPRVVASLDRDDLGAVAVGDTVEGFADVEVSVTCLEPMPKCVGSIYHYSPHIEAQLVLASDASATRGYRLGRPKAITCSQQLPNRNHHCVVELHRRALIEAGRGLNCASCHLNVVLSAHHEKSRRNNKLVIGVDSDDGIKQSKASISAAVYSADPELFRDRELSTSGKRVSDRVPIASHGGSTPERVLYSVALSDLQRGETLVASAEARTDISHLPYSVLTQAQLIVAEARNSTSFTGLPVQVITDNGKISEQNGYNCTQGRSDFRTACPIVKGGVAKILYNAKTEPRNDQGAKVPLYLNLVVSGAQEFGGSYHRGDAMKVLRGRIDVWRYPAKYGG